MNGSQTISRTLTVIAMGVATTVLFVMATTPATSLFAG